jgi:N-acetylglutamate synthase-like GNAT family acetyltransferase
MSDMPDNQPTGTGDGVSIALSPPSGNAIRLLDPGLDEAAAEILVPATEQGTTEAAASLIAASRADEGSAVYGLTANDRLAAVFITRRIPMSVEVAAIAVAADLRRKGHGRACLQEALRRAGKLPLVVESPEAAGFFKACGFKIVSRRVLPGGQPRFKLGWHAPGLRTGQHSVSALKPPTGLGGMEQGTRRRV